MLVLDYLIITLLFTLPCVSFVNVYQFVCVFVSLFGFEGVCAI